MLFEVLAEESNTLHIDQLDLEREEMTRYWDVESLLEIILAIHDFLR